MGMADSQRRTISDDDMYSVVCFANRSPLNNCLLSVYCVPDSQFNEPMGNESPTFYEVLLKRKCVSPEAVRERSSSSIGEGCPFEHPRGSGEDAA